MANPDDVCDLCGTTREMHGDRQHKFSLDGQLAPRDRQAPTMPSMNQLMGALNHHSGLMLRTINRLAARGLLGPEDLSFIFGGADVPNPGAETDRQTEADDPGRAAS